MDEISNNVNKCATSLNKHVVRDSNGNDVEIDRYTRTKAIKIMCVECMGYETNFVRQCTSYKCPLFPYRAVSLATKVPKGKCEDG